MGRVPVGDWRVGCMGRRSPGRSGGRAAGVPGRGRWKIGWPGIGRPGAGRADAPGSAAGCAGLEGALYTGRGPVWGTIIRRAGASGWAGTLGAADLATGVRGCIEAEAASDDATPYAEAAACAVGAAGGGTAVRGGDAVTGGTDIAAGGAAAWGGGATTGLTGGVGTTSLAGAAGGLGRVATGTFAAGWAVAAAAGFASTGGRAVTGWAEAASETCCLLLIAFRTSPGLEIWERSILVLISSASARLAREDRLEVWASLAVRRCARTFSASWSSRELE